jgi:hypothetical protein
VLTSHEAQSDLVSAAYLRFLNRSIDSASVAYSASLLAAGITDQQFYAQLLSTPEFYAKTSS